jgi:hypothetical protein
MGGKNKIDLVCSWGAATAVDEVTPLRLRSHLFRFMIINLIISDNIKD